MSVRTQLPRVEFWDAVVTAGPTLAAAATYLFACKQLVDVIGMDARTPTRSEQTLFWGLLWLVGGSYLIVTSIARSFRPQSRLRLLLSIGANYVALIVIFAGVNYVLCAIGDAAHTAAVARQYAEWVKAGERETAQSPTNLRAFRGTASLWTGVDAYRPNTGLDGWTSQEYLEAFKAAAAAGRRSVEPTFKPENWPLAFLDCLHFSIVTMTTTGYGDILPNQPYSKLAADFQILAGISVLVVALGMAFGGWWRRDPLDELRERLLFGEIGFRDRFWHDPMGAPPSHDALHTARQAAAPSCPRCGSQHVLSFVELDYPVPRAPVSHDPRESTIFFLLVLSGATWLVYSLVLPRYLGGLPVVGQRLAAPPLIAAVAMMIQVPLSQLARRLDRGLEPTWRAEHDQARARHSRSWSCESCRNNFATD